MMEIESGPNSRMQPLLSVVIVARNEARNIKRCLESVLETACLVPRTQVLLVDSASSDETGTIAQRYPISIVRLRPNWRLTASAGRYIGTLRTQSEYILFVDGDMALLPRWIEEGLAFLQAHPKAAAVSGEMDEVFVNADDQIVGTAPGRYRVTETMPVRALGGVGLYRRSALDEVGTFNPFVPLREEAELALRLRRRGYCLYRIPERIAIHYSPPRNTVRELERRRRAGYYAGFGRALYYAMRNHLGSAFLREQGMDYIYFAAYLLLGFACVAALSVTGTWPGLAVWIGLTALALVGYTFRKGDFKTAVVGYVARLLTVCGALEGILSALRDPPSYPTDVLIVNSNSDQIRSSVRTGNDREKTTSDDIRSSQVYRPADHRHLSL